MTPPGRTPATRATASPRKLSRASAATSRSTWPRDRDSFFEPQLDALHLTLRLDALQVKARDHGRVSHKAIYLAIGVNMQRLKEAPEEFNYQRAAQLWREACAGAEGRGLRLPDLRHAFTSRLLAAALMQTDMGRLPGHSTLRMTAPMRSFIGGG